MRALAIVHKYPPVHNAGAEWMLHAIFRDWTARGDECFVCYPDAPRSAFVFDGVTVFRTPARDLATLTGEVDVVVTHLDNTGQAVRAARASRRLLVHLLHNDRQLQFHNVKPGPDVLLVANSRWIEATIPRAYDVVVSRPHVELARYSVTHDKAGAVTLINLTAAKGSGMLFELAKADPFRAFLAVRGAYGVPARIPRTVRNIELFANTPDVTDVYRRTRVLLMPSEYESYGRVGIEAACSGIPTIAAPTPGLLESLGDAGIFVELRDRKGWRRALEMLDDPHVYAMASANARDRAERLEEATTAELDELHATVAALVTAKRYAPRPMPILDSLAIGASCPVCGARSCSCSGSTVLNGLGISVTDAPKTAGEPKAIYRTWAGDFRYSTTAARVRGLIADPDSDKLPDAIAARLGAAGVDLEQTRADYAKATDAGRQDFLDAINAVSPKALSAAASEYVGKLAGAGGRTPRRAAAGPADSAPPPPAAARVGDVLEHVGDDPDLIREALEAERAGRARPTLLAELERRLTLGDDQ